MDVPVQKGVMVGSDSEPSRHLVSWQSGQGPQELTNVPGRRFARTVYRKGQTDRSQRTNLSFSPIVPPTSRVDPFLPDSRSGRPDTGQASDSAWRKRQSNADSNEYRHAFCITFLLTAPTLVEPTR